MTPGESATSTASGDAVLLPLAVLTILVAPLLANGVTLLGLQRGRSAALRLFTAIVLITSVRFARALHWARTRSRIRPDSRLAVDASARQPVASAGPKTAGGPAVRLPFAPPLQPMLSSLAAGLPDGDGWQFEPKWDGFRTLVFRDGDEIVLQSRDAR